MPNDTEKSTTSPLIQSTGSDLEQRLRRSEDARRSLSDALDFLQAKERRLVDAIKSAWIIMDNIEDECAEIWQDEFQDIIFPND